MELGFKLELASITDVQFTRPVKLELCTHFKKIQFPLLAKSLETGYLSNR